jgi:hypothetical protein
MFFRDIVYFLLVYCLLKAPVMRGPHPASHRCRKRRHAGAGTLVSPPSVTPIAGSRIIVIPRAIIVIIVVVLVVKVPKGTMIGTMFATTIETVFVGTFMCVRQSVVELIVRVIIVVFIVVSERRHHRYTQHEHGSH